MARSEEQERLPYWKFFPTDFVASVSWWPCDAVGAYIIVLCHAWSDGPLTDAHLNAILARVSEDGQCLIRERLAKVGTGWTHPRLHTDREEAIAQVRASREYGRMGQAAKRSKASSLPTSDTTTPPARGATSPPASEAGTSIMGGGGIDSCLSEGEGVGEGFKMPPEWFADLHRWPQHRGLTQRTVDAQIKFAGSALQSESLARPLATRLLRSWVKEWPRAGVDVRTRLGRFLDGLDGGVKNRAAVVQSRAKKEVGA